MEREKYCHSLEWIDAMNGNELHVLQTIYELIYESSRIVFPYTQKYRNHAFIKVPDLGKAM